MIWQTLRGHQQQAAMFRRAAGRGRLAQAYLFTGPEGVGKLRFARLLAQCLFCQRVSNEELDACGECPSCRQMAAGSHPDFHEIGLLPGKTELLIDQFAGEQEKRGREGLCHDLSLRPMSADRKIAVVDDAHRMNVSAANTFLKTLEEPPPGSMLVLIAPAADDLLPTIRSRCQLVRFSPLPDRDVAALLLEAGQVTEPAEAEQVAALSGGSLATARQLVDPHLRGLRDRLYDALARERYDAVTLSEQLLEGLGELGDKQAERQGALWLVRFATEFYRRALRELSGSRDGPVITPACRFARTLCETAADPEALVMGLLERTMLAESQLERRPPAPTPLCLETLFDDLGRMQR